MDEEELQPSPSDQPTYEEISDAIDDFESPSDEIEMEGPAK